MTNQSLWKLLSDIGRGSRIEIDYSGEDAIGMSMLEENMYEVESIGVSRLKKWIATANQSLLEDLPNIWKTQLVFRILKGEAYVEVWLFGLFESKQLLARIGVNGESVAETK